MLIFEDKANIMYKKRDVLKGIEKMSNINPDIKTVMFAEEQIKDAVKRVAAEITKDFDTYSNSGKKLMLVCILKGSLIFMADLIREIDLPLTVDFMKASSYGSGTKSSGMVNVSLDLKYDNLKDYNVIVVEDIIDSGNTLAFLLGYIKDKGANSVKLCSLLDKPSRRTVDINVDYCGMQIPDEFVVGYGLDFDERYRNLPYIGVLKPEVYEN